MKRSKTVALTIMSASAVLLQACDDQEVQGQVFRDLESCIIDGNLSEEQCREYLKEAEQEHTQAAPRFASREECYAEFGYDQCQQTTSPGGGSFWMPLMMGFFAGRALDGFGGGQRYAEPLYRSTRDPNTLRTGNNYPVSRSYGTTAQLPEWATKPARTRTQTIGRGGFGSRSSGWGRGWGG